LYRPGGGWREERNRDHHVLLDAKQADGYYLPPECFGKRNFDEKAKESICLKQGS